MVNPKNPDAFKSIQPPIHREHYEPEPPREPVSFLKCTINECGYEMPIHAAPEPLEGTERPGTDTSCPKCGGLMEVQKKS